VSPNHVPSSGRSHVERGSGGARSGKPLHAATPVERATQWYESQEAELRTR
jgi:hypothetical protein